MSYTEDEKRKIKLALARLNPNTRTTYHAPHGKSRGGYVVHEYGKEISGYHDNYVDAELDAIQRLKKQKEA